MFGIGEIRLLELEGRTLLSFLKEKVREGGGRGEILHNYKRGTCHRRVTTTPCLGQRQTGSCSSGGSGGKGEAAIGG
jgi:hypothetical protein